MPKEIVEELDRAITCECDKEAVHSILIWAQSEILSLREEVHMRQQTVDALKQEASLMKEISDRRDERIMSAIKDIADVVRDQHAALVESIQDASTVFLPNKNDYPVAGYQSTEEYKEAHGVD